MLRASCIILLLSLAPLASADSAARETETDLLVTFENEGARVGSARFGAPYRARKRYAVSRAAARLADTIAREYELERIDAWLIRSLSVYCIVYRVRDGESRDDVIARLEDDPRVESVQAMHQFETSSPATTNYNDTYANLQYGLEAMDLVSAHLVSRGRGVRIAVVDSAVDAGHEDLLGRVGEVVTLTDRRRVPDVAHGTAIMSIIVANSNNAAGIIGVAPEATLQLLVACWSEQASPTAVCNSFTLAKAFDTLLDAPPDVLNLSLVGPPDPLLERLLRALNARNVIIIAAAANDPEGQHAFPASMTDVIAVSRVRDEITRAATHPSELVYAPGEEILVAVPGDQYDFRSGNSLATAHVSGVVALLLAVAPDAPSDLVAQLLRQSQDPVTTQYSCVNACRLLNLADAGVECAGASTATVKR